MIGRTLSYVRTNEFVARIMRNLAWIVLSQGVVTLLGIVTLAVSARALGAAGLGIIALVEAYTRMVGRLTHLEPWQAVIRHGSAALETNDEARFNHLIGLSIVIDLVGGVVAAVVALALAPLLGPKLGLSEAQVPYLSFAALAILISYRATGIAILRLYDRFDLQAKIDGATALFRMLLSLLAFALGGGIGYFVAIFIAFSVADGLAVFLVARREMRRRGHTPRYRRLREVLMQNPGFFRLMWNSNLSVIWRQSTERFDTLILAALLPSAAIGYYHIARRVGAAAMRLGRPLKQALYPELTRLAARSDWVGIGRMVRVTTMGFGLVLMLVLPPVLWQIEPIITFLFGAAFAPAAPVVAIQSVAVSITLSGVILGPTLLSLEKDGMLVRASALSAILFFVLLVPAVLMMGVEGAAVARLATNAIWLLLLAWILWRTLRVHRVGPKLTWPEGVS